MAEKCAWEELLDFSQHDLDVNHGHDQPKPPSPQPTPVRQDKNAEAITVADAAATAAAIFAHRENFVGSMQGDCTNLFLSQTNVFGTNESAYGQENNMTSVSGTEANEAFAAHVSVISMDELPTAATSVSTPMSHFGSIVFRGSDIQPAALPTCNLADWRVLPQQRQSEEHQESSKPNQQKEKKQQQHGDTRTKKRKTSTPCSTPKTAKRKSAKLRQPQQQLQQQSPGEQTAPMDIHQQQQQPLEQPKQLEDGGVLCVLRLLDTLLPSLDPSSREIVLDLLGATATRAAHDLGGYMLSSAEQLLGDMGVDVSVRTAFGSGMLQRLAGSAVGRQGDIVRVACEGFLMQHARFTMHKSG